MSKLIILITLFVAIIVVLNVISYNYGYSTENQTAFRKGYMEGVEKGNLAGFSEGNHSGETKGTEKAVQDHDNDYVYWEAEGYRQAGNYVNYCIHEGQLK